MIEQSYELVAVRADMRMDEFVDMYLDMCVGMHTDMCIDMIPGCD